MKYRIVIKYSEEDDGYIATVPELEGCSAFGETYEAAAHEITVAMKLWLESAKANSKPIPEPDVVVAS